MIIPKEIWESLLQATYAMENNDNTMSGEPSRRAENARDWLLDQDYA